MKRSAVIASLLAAALAGCAARKPAAQVPSVATANATREFVDLEPGWRLRILAPVTKSGAYVVDMRPHTQGGVITLKTSDDLIGYETAFWAIQARPGGGVQIRLTSAELTRDGVAAPIQTPSRAVVHVARYARFLRIFYLTRRSGADHDMAMVGAGTRERLEMVTQALRVSPAEACVNQPRERVYCEWIPAGMAVRPEVPKIVDGATRWVDRF